MTPPTGKKKRPKKVPDRHARQLGDTPVPSWQMPTPEEKEQTKPVRRALKDAISTINSQE